MNSNSNDKKPKKKLYIKLSEDNYSLLRSNADKRDQDHTNYIIYLIQNDKEDMQSKRAALALDNISAAVIELKTMYNENKPFTYSGDNKCNECMSIIGQIQKGVTDLWHCLH